jgi:excisionase family DNA binding protein
MSEAKDRLLTAEELAQYLNVTKHCIYRLVEQNRIPHLRVGRAVRFNVQEVTEYLKKRSGARSVRTSEVSP